MQPITFRVIRLPQWDTYDGWIWLDGYELNAAGDAVERRSVFVQINGLRWAGDKPAAAARSAPPGMRNMRAVPSARPAGAAATAPRRAAANTR